MAKDIFISYKNDNSSNQLAARLTQDLESLGFTVYFNSHERTSGDFPSRLRRAIQECKDVIVVVSQGCIDQLVAHNNVDWIREEILEARRDGKNIVPVLMDGVSMPNESEMPAELSFFPYADAAILPEQYTKPPIESLLGFLTSKPHGGSAFRDLANGNPKYIAKDELRKELENAGTGDVDAMYRAGMMLYYGFESGVEGKAKRDFRAAEYWLKKVAEEDEGDLGIFANMLLGRMYYTGASVEQSYEESFRRYSLAEKNPYAAQQAAFARRIGCGCDYNYAEIERYYLDTVAKGDDFAKVGLAQFYEIHGRFKDAAQTYLSMNSMSPESSYRLGLIYRNGTHVLPPLPDYEKASICFQNAMEKGHVESALELGTLYFRPTMSFHKDFSKAQNCFEMAADAGNAEAQYMLGFMYEYGHVRKDLDESIRYFEMAASQGNLLSSAHLATLYQLVDPCDHELAFRHCKIAADYGDSNCEFMLGNMYLLGRGCKADMTLARRYYQKALDHGFSQAKPMLASLESKRGTHYDGLPDWLE